MLRAAVVAYVSRTNAVGVMGSQLLRVLAEGPPLQALHLEASEPWMALLAEAIAARVPGIDADTAHALASGHEAVANAAIRAWARGCGVGAPADRVEAALAHLALA